MIYPEQTCFFTGHRTIPVSQREHIKNELTKAAADLIENKGVTNFITGGAIGFDTLAAFAVLDLKKMYPQIRLHLYLPCTDQTKRWRKADVNNWEYLLNHADSHQYVFNHTYINGCMQLRNRAMAKDSKYCIAYCTRPNSGTHSTVKFAKELGISVHMLA